MHTSFMAKPPDLLHYAQYLGDVFDCRRTHGDKEHGFVLRDAKSGPVRRLSSGLSP